MGRTLLSDAFDLGVDLGADLAVDVEATSGGVGHCCPTLLTLVLPLLLVLVLPMWVGHSCPTPLTLLLILGLTLPLMLERQVGGRALLSDGFDLVVDLGADLAVHVEATSVGSNTPVRRFSRWS